MTVKETSSEPFLSTTQFHGFMYTVSDGRKTKLFWWLLTLISAALCVNDFVHLVVVYHTEPTQININIKTNQQISFKTPTLCMEMAVLGDWTVPWGPVEQMSSEIDKLINMTTTNNLKIDASQIDITVLTYTYLMLGSLTKLELYHTGQSQDRLDSLEAVVSQLPIDQSFIDKIMPPNTTTILPWLLAYYSHKRVSLVKLKSVIAAAICSQHVSQFLQYRHPGDLHPQSLPFCQPHMITYMGYSLICSRMFPTDTVPINSTTPYKTFAITNTQQFTTSTQIGAFETLRNNPYGDFSINSEYDWVKFLWYLDFEGREVLPVGSLTNIFSWNSNRMSKVDVTVDRRVQMYNRNSQQCSEANDQYSCEWQIRAARMAQSCNCWPSTLMHISKAAESNMSDCYTTIRSTSIPTGEFVYPQCGQNLSYLSGLGENICLPNCIQTSYGATKHNLGTVLESVSPYEEYPFFGYLEIQFQFGGNCVEIAESPATSWSSFVWTFGGSMGTWLGGSVLALVHIPYYMLKRLGELRQRRKKISPTTPKQIDMYGRSNMN